jgi:hypothetical protein
MVMASKSKVLVIDGDGNFLSSNGKRWVPDCSGDVFEARYSFEAIAAVRKAPRAPGQRIFISSRYGYEDQMDQEVIDNGTLGAETYPNQHIYQPLAD